MAYKMKPVDKSELANLLESQPGRGRASKGAASLEEFMSSGETAVRFEFGSTNERNSMSLSIANAAKRAGSQVWVKKIGGGTGTDLLLVNLAKADAATRRLYDNRPRVGRKPSK